MARTNEEFQNKVVDLENQAKTLQQATLLQQRKTSDLYTLLEGTSLGLGVLLVALIAVMKNQTTRMKISLNNLQASIESRKN